MNSGVANSRFPRGADLRARYITKKAAGKLSTQPQGLGRFRSGHAILWERRISPWIMAAERAHTFFNGSPRRWNSPESAKIHSGFLFSPRSPHGTRNEAAAVATRLEYLWGSFRYRARVSADYHLNGSNLVAKWALGGAIVWLNYNSFFFT